MNVQDELLPQLIENSEKAADVDARVLEAYIHQCTAEAQEGCLCCLMLSNNNNNNNNTNTRGKVGA